MPTKSVSLLVLVKAGSRYENASQKGISHFLEHMFFKGGKKYTTAKSVSEAIDSVGGSFNAFTGKESAGYSVRCSSADFSLASDVLSDMLLYAPFYDSEIEKERGVILEELHMYEDTPLYQSGWDFEKFMYGDQPLGWDTIGEKECITSVQSQDFHQYKKELYTPDNMVISVAGGLSLSEVQQQLENDFSSLSGKVQRSFLPVEEKKPSVSYFSHKKNTEQVHFVFGGFGVPAKHPDQYTQKLVSLMLGGMMSSRMFLRIREEKGLCYYISSAVDEYIDSGLLSVSAGVDRTRFAESIEAIQKEYDEILKHGFLDEELLKVKKYSMGQMTLSLESSSNIAYMNAKQLLLYTEVLTPEQIFDRITAVTKQEVQDFVHKFFQKDNRFLSFIGPYDSL
jgi:predicted Zn-dependent peptidase